MASHTLKRAAGIVCLTAASLAGLGRSGGAGDRG